MVKRELIKRATDKYNGEHLWSRFTPTMIEDVLSAVVSVIIDALIEEGKITIRGLMSIEVVDYGDKKRKGYNPFADKPIEYKQKKRIRCRLSKQIRDAINNN